MAVHKFSMAVMCIIFASECMRGCVYYERLNVRACMPFS